MKPVEKIIEAERYLSDSEPELAAEEIEKTAQADQSEPEESIVTNPPFNSASRFPGHVERICSLAKQTSG